DVLNSGGTMDIPELTVPQAITGLKESGSDQALVTPGTAAAGSIEYSLDNNTWSTDVPQAKDKGDYTVYYRLKYGDNNSQIYTSLQGAKGIPVTIDEAEQYPLWVGGTQVTSANAGNIDGNNKASYDAASRTLTLNGYSYTGVGYKMGSTDEACAAIYWSDSDNPLTIQLSGTNSIVRTGQSDSRYGDSAYYGIYSPGDIIIKGPATASLSVDGGDTESQDRKNSYGISAKTTIQDVQVTATGTSTGITRLSAIQRANVTATGGSYGISSYTLEISENSTVTATGGSSAIDHSGPPECVKNAIPGTGWTNTEGTEGKAAIAISTEGQNISSYKKVQFPAVKEPATVTKAPEAKTLTYNDSAQELVTAGEVTGGEMQYALGENATTAPDASAYTTSIPTATDAGTYYVWYKAVGDDNHNDSEPDKVGVTISPATDNNVSVSITGWTYGDEANAPSITADFGADTVVFTYSDARDGEFTTEVPVNAGSWYVKASVAATDNYAAGEAVAEFEIADPGYRIIKGGDATWTKGTDGSISIEIVSSEEPDGSFARYKRTMDGDNELNVVVTQGSTIVTFAPEVLEKMAEGKHTITVEFTNGSVSTTLTILPKQTSGEDTPAADTSEDPIAAILLVTIFAAGAMALTKRRKRA
ncbi:MAG: copper resistance protein CopC, partial [Lachnospiraceae bacterium]|nr:copper resistance protein CopC [Lachnospiraceae bacterium]